MPTPRQIEVLALLAAGARHGRELAQHHERDTGERLPYGTLYPLLKQLARLRWVKVHGPNEGERVQRVELTERGAGALVRAHTVHSRLAALAQAALLRLPYRVRDA